MNTPETSGSYESRPEYDYHIRMEHILDRSLTPENIDAYASRALDDLIELVRLMTESYESQPTLRFDTVQDTENAAMNYYDFQLLGSILDHIAQKEEQILNLTAFEATIPADRRVFVPPDAIDTDIVAGDESEFEDKQHIARLKTILFLLENNFSIDIYDPERVRVSKGTNDPDMMRGESYYNVVIPELQRQVLVCDEEGNVTYVFDAAQLQAYDNQLDVTQLTKSELNTLLVNNPQAGKRLRYSPFYVENMIRLLSADDENADVDDSAKYLIEKAPEGYLSAGTLAKSLGVTYKSTQLAIAACDDMLGETKSYRFHASVAIGYSPEQQAVICQYLAENGYLETKAPTGIVSASRLAATLGVKERLVFRAIEELGDALGEVTSYMFSRWYVPGYTESQQQQIIMHLSAANRLPSELPEGYLSMQQFSDEIGINLTTINRTVRDLSDTLGDILYGTPGDSKKRARVLSPEQQGIIEEHLSAKGTLTPIAPEGYVNCNIIAAQFGLAHATAKRALEELAEQGRIANTNIYRFGVSGVPCYSPAEQEVIHAYCSEMGLLRKEAPDGYLSASGMAHTWDLSDKTIARAIEAASEDLGPVQRYRFGPKRTSGYSPEQQSLIRHYLTEWGFFTDVPPENYISIAGLARVLGVSHDLVSKTVNNLSENLGTIQLHRYRGRPVPSLDPNQQALISQQINQTK